MSEGFQISANLDVPNMFDANQHPPKFNMVRDAFQAVSNASFLSLSTFSFGVASVAWIYDIGNLREFGLIMKKALGGIDREKQLAAVPVEKKVAEIESSLEQALGGKK